jgi:Zn-dependent M28 family amino/carboxypeptidase
MRYEKDVRKIPAAAVSAADADQIERFHAMGVALQLSLKLQARVLPHAPSGNVVADIVGREKPEEIVLLGAHLDSWDLGTGAVDDAAGVGIVVAAALRAAGSDLSPKRTIRVVLYGAEEVGVHGGDAYAKAHAHEVKSHVAAMEADFGTGAVWRYRTKVPESDLPFYDEIGRAIAPLGIERGGNDGSGGADIEALMKLGVPIVSLGQDGTTYFDLHHTANDTLDKIDPVALEQCVEAYARTERMIANR